MKIELRDRFESIDALRGGAAVFVCLFHFTCIENFLPDNNLLKTIGSYGYLGVEIFFIISGFIIPFSLYKGNFLMKDIIIFFSKRILRIEPPYLISIALAILLKYLSTFSSLYKGPIFHIDLTGLLLHIGYLCEIFHKDWLNPVYWTLAIEFQFYILIALCYSYFISSNNKYLFIGFLLIANMPIFLGMTGKQYVFHFMPYFSLGIMLFRTMIHKNAMTEYYGITCLLLALIWFQSGIPALVVCVFTLFVMIAMKHAGKVLHFLGSISYSLYLFHILIGTRILNLSMNYTQNEWFRSGIIFFALIVSVFTSYIFYLLVEKPFMNFSHRLTYKK